MDAINYKKIYRLLRIILFLIILIGFQKLSVSQNYALTFDGSGDYVDFGNPAALQITGSQTFEMWIYPYDLSARRNPIAKAYGGEGTITLETNGTLSYYYGTGGANNNPYQSFTSSASISANQWMHVAIVRDLDAMKLYWYIDGVLAGQADAQYSYAQNGSLSMFLGKGYVSNYYGMIDEVRIWNVAKSPSEINANKNLSMTGFEEGLAAYWTFSEGSGPNVIDHSANSNNGTIYGNTSYVVSDAPIIQYTPGNEPFEPVPPTGLPYNIVLSGLDINGQNLPIGTQIGVFDGDLCVGDIYYNGEGSQNLVAWEADPDHNLAGFTAGNTMSFKFHIAWHSELRNFDADAVYETGDGTFGFGTFSVAGLSATTGLVPDFSISESRLNFNTVVVNESKSLSLVIENNGTAILYVNSIQNTDSHFTVSAQSLLIQPAEFDTLWVTFVPTEITTYADVLTMTSDDPDTPSVEIPLNGTGLPQPTPQISVTPSSLDFGGVAMNTTSTLNLNVYNAGNGTLTVTGITSSNPAFGIFGGTSFSLEQGENANIAVVFSPTESGVFTGQLTIQNNDEQVLVPVSGVASQGHFTGVDPTGLPYPIIVDYRN